VIISIVPITELDDIPQVTGLQLELHT
jgi:hypothetical protein